jgi:hypothetical protein
MATCTCPNAATDGPSTAPPRTSSSLWRGAAGIATDNARLFAQVRAGSEQFQRLLLPTLPDLRPLTGAAVHRPATAPAHLGDDGYGTILLPDPQTVPSSRVTARCSSQSKQQVRDH